MKQSMLTLTTLYAATKSLMCNVALVSMIIKMIMRVATMMTMAMAMAMATLKEKEKGNSKLAIRAPGDFWPCRASERVGFLHGTAGPW